MGGVSCGLRLFNWVKLANSSFCIAGSCSEVCLNDLTSHRTAPDCAH